MVSFINILFAFSLIFGLICINVADKQDYLYPCFTYLHCVEELDAKFEENAEKCLTLARKEHFEIFTSKMTKAGFDNFNVNDLKEFRAEYCSIDEETREIAFNEIITIGIEKYSEYCSDPLLVSECDIANKLNMCGSDLLDELHDNGLC